MHERHQEFKNIQSLVYRVMKRAEKSIVELAVWRSPEQRITDLGKHLEMLMRATGPIYLLLQQLEAGFESIGGLDSAI